MFNTSLTWIQNGEDITGGTLGDNVGTLNRTSIELLENDQYLYDNTLLKIESFIARDVIPIHTVCVLDITGMKIATNTTKNLSEGLLSVSMEDININTTGLFCLIGKIPIVTTSFKKLYLGVNGAISITMPSVPSYGRVLGYSGDSCIFFFPHDTLIERDLDYDFGVV